MKFLTSYLLSVVFITVVGGCKFAFKDPCLSVTCLNGADCQSDSSYYCENRVGGICPPVATCTPNDDPCQGFYCPRGSLCIRVTDNCTADKPCKMKAQCNVQRRPGYCPDPDNTTITSCQSHCEDSDHMCEKDMKCCYIKAQLGNYCVPLV